MLVIDTLAKNVSEAMLSQELVYQNIINGLSPAEQQKLPIVADYACSVCQSLNLVSQEPAWNNALGTVQILSQLGADANTRMAAMLEHLPDTEAHNAWLQKNVPTDVMRLVVGFRSLAQLGRRIRPTEGQPYLTTGLVQQPEMLRKMLLAMASDLRIVLMRLSARLQSLRWCARAKVQAPYWMSYEALHLYAPLASRLGIWQIKWELEDLAFRSLNPDAYHEIASMLEEKRGDRANLITQVIDRLHQTLQEENVEADISGRPKHIYSIWNKMRNKKLNFNRLFDLRAIRVIVEDIRTCYTVLGVVHNLWTPNLNEFDDYISRPKPNGYRSLHTIVQDDEGRLFEIQIRTKEMHQFAEYGVAAHWHYKEAGAKGGTVGVTSEYDKKLGWLRQLLAWKVDVDTDTAEDSTTSLEGLDNQIYVLTPDAKVIELTQGATPVDFAYAIHTDLGHRCRGAKVDGQMVNLQTSLKTGQTVEILAAKSGGPSRDWLNPQLKYLASSRSRAKVRQWFNAIDLQARIQQGSAIVEKELQRLGKTSVNQQLLAEGLGFSCADDLYVSVAKDEFSIRQIDHFFTSPAPEEEISPESLTQKSKIAQGGKSGVLVVGVDALLTQLAKCCRPVPPDPIMGFVTRGRGVSIHRQDCKSLQVLLEKTPERMIDVTWGSTEERMYAVDVFVLCDDRYGLLRDITDVFAKQRLNVVGVNTQSRQQQAKMLFTVEVKGTEQLQRALQQIREVKGVIQVERQ